MHLVQRKCFHHVYWQLTKWSYAIVMISVDLACEIFISSQITCHLCNSSTPFTSLYTFVAAFITQIKFCCIERAGASQTIHDRWTFSTLLSTCSPDVKICFKSTTTSVKKSKFDGLPEPHATAKGNTSTGATFWTAHNTGQKQVLELLNKGSPSMFSAVVISVSNSLWSVDSRAVPEFGSGSGWNPAFFANLADIRLWPKLGRISAGAGFGKLSLNNTNLNYL